MKNKGKISSIVLLSALTLITAASCGGKSGSTTSSAPVAQFDLWTGFGATYTMYIDKLVEFELNKNNIKVNHSSKGSYEKLQKAINESIPTLDYPMIANGYPDHFAGYIRPQIQVPLDTFIADYDKENGTNLLSDYYDDYMKENKSLAYRQDGTPYVMGVPFNKSTELLGYNGYFVDYAKQENVITKIPETWQEWAIEGPKLRKLQLDMCGKYLHGSVDVAGNASNMVLNDVSTGEDILLDMHEATPETSRLMSWDAADNMFITVVRQWGGVYTSYTKEDASKKDPHGWVEFNNETAVNEDGVTVQSKARTLEALKFFDGLFGDKSSVNPDYTTQIFGLPANFGGLFSSDAFKANKVMFTVCSSGGLSYNTGGTQRFRLAPIPYYNDGENTRKYVISQGTNLALFDQGNDAEKKAAFKTIVDFTTGEAQAQWAVDTGYFPASKSAATHKIYTDMLSSTSYENPNLVAYRESAAINEEIYMKDSLNWRKFVDPGFVGSSTIRETVGDILENVFNGVGVEEGVTYESVLADAYNHLKDYVH